MMKLFGGNSWFSLGPRPCPYDAKTSKTFQTQYQMRLRIGFMQMKGGVWSCVFNENLKHLEWKPK